MKGLLWLVVVLSFSSIALAQQEKFEIFGGYSHMQLEGGRQNKSGWSASVAYRLHGPLSLVTDASGYYRTLRIFQPQFESFRVHSSDHYVLFGPQFDVPVGTRLLNPFVKGLAGFVRESSPVVLFSQDQGWFAGPKEKNNHFGVGAGVGLDVQIDSTFFIRPIQIDWVRTVRKGEEDSNPWRISVGVGLSF